jgi:hypothetical protein
VKVSRLGWRMECVAESTSSASELTPLWYTTLLQSDQAASRGAV